MIDPLGRDDVLLDRVLKEPVRQAFSFNAAIINFQTIVYASIASLR